MCLRFVFLLATRVAAGLRLSRREQAWKEAEILILRHQLAVLQRQQPGRVKLNWADVLFLTGLSRMYADERTEARDDLVRLLADRDPEVRLVAARALGELGDAAAAAPLLQSLAGPRPVPLRVVARSLARLGSGTGPTLVEGLAADSALARGSVKALVVMAFLAVFREGLETAVFLVAVFENSDNTTAAGSGAILGLALAAVVGYALYKGGLRFNMARFFRITGVVLVLVVAGLLASAAHSAHEAGWLNTWQGQVFDLSSIIKPGSVQSALATGMLGIQPKPVQAEVFAWLLAVIPLMLFVLWPAKRSRPTSAAAATPTSRSTSVRPTAGTAAS